MVPVLREMSLRETGSLLEKNSPVVREGSINSVCGNMSDWNELD